MAQKIIQKWIAKDRKGRTCTIRQHGPKNFTFVGYSDYQGIRGTYGPFSSLATCKTILARNGVAKSKWTTTGKIKRRKKHR